MPHTEDEQVFFVPVRDSVPLRKEVLGTVKKSLVLLKRYEKFRLLREEKVKRYHDLRVLVKEIDFLNKKLEKALPKTHLRAEETSKEPILRTRIETRRPSKALSDLDKLEYELQSIETKIKTLQ